MSTLRRFSRGQRGRGEIVATVPAAAPIVPEVPVFDLLPNYWFRADNVTLTGVNVATIPNKVGIDALVIAGTSGALPAPVADPLFLDKPSIVFTGTQYLDSSLPSTSWAFLSDGTGFEAFHVYAPTNTAVQSFVSGTIATGQAGHQLLMSAGGISTFVVANGATVFSIASTSSVLANNVPTYSDVYYKSTEPLKAVLFAKDVAVASTTTEAVAPGGGTTNFPFCLGSRSDRAVPAQMRWCETLIFKRVLSEGERQTVRTYIQNRYGITAPVVTPSEETIFKLKPRNWVRAQENTNVGGFVTAFNDKAMPGHKLQQATPAQQVAVPVADPLYANKLTANFAGAQWYDSTLPPSAWQFFHDGTGSEFFLVATLTPGNPSVSVPLTTRVSGTGVTLIHASSSAAPYIYIQNGANVVTNQSEPGTINWPVNTGTYISYAFKNSAPMPLTGWVESAVSLASKPTNPFITGLDPNIALRLGSTGSTEHVLMKWAEVLVFNRALTEIERQTVREYIQDRYAILAPTINANDRPVFELQPQNWFRASNFTTAGANVDKFYDKVQPGHVLAQATPANQVVAPLADPLFANALTANFTGTQWYNSNALPSAWQFLNDGSGCEEFTVYQSPSSSPQILWTTGILAPDVRSQRYVQATGQVMVYINGTSLASPGVTQLPGDAFYGNFFCKNGAPIAAVSFAKSNVVASTIALSLAQVTPATSLSLGANAIGELGITMRWCESLFFNRVLTEYERQQVREYIQVRYGIVAPGISPSDKAILKLKPRNWLRADSVTVAAGRATELLDKAMPGAKLTQATPTFQGVVATDPMHGSKPALVFTNITGYTSNLAPAAWTFLHSGSGSDMRHAYRVNTLGTAVPGNSVFLSTTNTSGQNGVILYISPGGTNRRLYQVWTPSIVSFSAPADVVNDLNPTFDGMVLGLSSNPDFKYLDGTSLLYSADVINAPNAGDPQSTLLMGGGGGGGGFDANWTESLYFDRVLNPLEEKILLQYYTERYTPNAVDKPIFDLLPAHWFRADTVTLNAGNVATIPNRVSSDVLAISAGTLAAPVPDALFAGAPSINFTGTQRLDSNLTASAWKFLHDGTGMEIFHVLVGTSSALGVVAATLAPSNPGFQHYIVGDGAYNLQVNASPGIVADLRSANTATPVGVASYIDSYMTSTQFPNAVVFDHQAASLTHVTLVTTPFTGDPAGPLRLGNQVGASPIYPANMRWCETLIFKRKLTEYDRQQVREYIQARYGIAAPVLTTNEKEVLKLNPYSWIRGDSYTESAGKVNAVVDKAMPGHQLTQGTAANQVSTPVPSSFFSNKPVFNFTAAQSYISTLPAAAWAPFHGGTAGNTIYASYRLNTNASWQCLFTTTNSGAAPGFVAYPRSVGGTPGLEWAVFTNTGTVFAALASSVTTIPVLTRLKLTPTSYEGRQNGEIVFSGVPAAQFSGPSQLPLRFGGFDATQAPLNAQVADALLFDRALNATEDAIVQKYYAERYVALALDKPILDLAPAHWFRADSAILSGANVANIPNRVGTDALVMGAGTLAAPAPDALFAGAPSLNFTGTQWLRSNLPAASWNFTSDGTGFEEVSVYTNTTSGASATWSTQNGTNGYLHFTNVTSGSHRISNAGVASYDVVVGNDVQPSTAMYRGFSFSTASDIDAMAFVNASVRAPQQVVTPSGPVDVPMTLGSFNGSFLANMRWCETLIFKRKLTEYERQQVREYIQQKYGIAAPTVTTAEKTVLKLQPRNWVRAEDYNTSGTTVSSFRDKAMPGHLLSAASTQVANPVADPLYAGKPTASFNELASNHAYDSSLPASAWKFIHDGTGCEVFTVATVAANANNQVVWCTRLGGSFAGCALVRGNNSQFQTIFMLNDGGGAIVVGVGGTNIWSSTTGTYVSYALKSSAPIPCTTWVESTADIATQLAAAPGSGDPQNAFRLGMDSSQRATMKFAEVLIFNRVLSEYERQQVREYLQDRYGIVAPVVPPSERTILSLLPRNWLRAAEYTTAGANVASFRDKVLAGHTLAQATAANQVVIPTADGLFAGKPSANFTGSKWYVSSLLPTHWKFLNDGTGFEEFSVYRSPANASMNIWNTGPAVGTRAYRAVAATGQVWVSVEGAANNFIQTPNNTQTPDAAFYGNMFCKLGAPIALASLAQATSIGTPIVSITVSTTDPQTTLGLGATTTGGGPATMNWCETLFFNRVLTEYERQQVREYIQDRYGITAPVISSDDREILAMNPYSWIRADNYITSGTLITSFKDKALPGHTLSQATPAQQIANPVIDANFNNQLAAPFTGVNGGYQSNLAPAAWTFLHDGTGAFLQVVLKLNSSGGTRQELIRTLSSTNGFAYIADTSNTRQIQIYTAGAQSLGSNSSFGMVIPRYEGMSLSTADNPDMRLFVNGLQVASANPTGALPSGAPDYPLYFGSFSGSQFFLNARVPELLLVFNRLLTPAELVKIQLYFQKRYGISPA